MRARAVLGPEVTREAWLAARRSGIGGSDVAAVLGLSPWRTPLAVWHEKTAEPDDDVDNDAMEWGRRLEDAVAVKFADEHPELEVLPAPGLLADPEVPIFLATPDRLVASPDYSTGILECKTAGWRSSSEWDDDGMPPQYVVQVLWYLGITGADVAHVACLIEGRRYLERVVERDDVAIERMRERVAEWWAAHVETGTPPPATPPTDDKLLARIYAASERLEVTLDPEVLDLVSQARSLDAVIASLEADRASLATRIKEALGPATDGMSPTGELVVSWRPRKGSTSIDRKALEAEHPDVYAEVVRIGAPTRTFRLLSPKD